MNITILKLLVEVTLLFLMQILKYRSQKRENALEHSPRALSKTFISISTKKFNLQFAKTCSGIQVVFKTY